MILISKRSRKQTADNNQETTINFSKRMLKFKHQKATTIRFLITAYKTKKQHILLACCTYARQHDFILIAKLN